LTVDEYDLLTVTDALINAMETRGSK